MYKYEVWFEGHCLRTSENIDEYYEDEEEAYNEGSDTVIDIMNDWEAEGCYEGEKFDDFEIKVIEV